MHLLKYWSHETIESSWAKSVHPSIAAYWGTHPHDYTVALGEDKSECHSVFIACTVELIFVVDVIFQLLLNSSKWTTWPHTCESVWFEIYLTQHESHAPILLSDVRILHGWTTRIWPNEAWFCKSVSSYYEHQKHVSEPITFMINWSVVTKQFWLEYPIRIAAILRMYVRLTKQWLMSDYLHPHITTRLHWMVCSIILRNSWWSQNHELGMHGPHLCPFSHQIEFR